MPSTPLARQYSFKGVPRNEGVERILNASLRVEGNFDALDPEPAVAHAFFAQEVGAAGLADIPHNKTALRQRMFSENTE